MRECPKCGYRDPPIWRSYRYMTDVDQTRYEDFIEECTTGEYKDHPEWKNIKMGEIVEDKCNYYRRSSNRNQGRYVLKWPKFYGRDYYKTRYWEHVNAKISKRPRPGQQPLMLQGVKANGP